jgi:hypothetical protein
MGVPLRIERASVYERDAASNGNTPLNVELVVFDRVRPRQTPRCATLSFGAGLPIVGFDAVRRNETPKDQSSAVLSWSRAHPLLRGVGLDSVFIAHALALQDPAQANAADRAPGVTIRELARGIDGPLILLAEDRGVRRVVVGFDLAQSNWPVQVGFPIFLASAIDYLTMRGEDEAGQAFTTREPAELASRRIAPGPIVLDGPMHVEIAPTNAGNTTGINLGVLERAGVYTLAGAPADAPVKVAVNLCDATTSRLEGADRLTISGQSLEASGRDEARRELWTWFVLAGAGLLIIEWMLNAWQTRV